MNWQCPRCETFNHATEKQCEVCELAKPKKKRATKTAPEKTDLFFVTPPGSNHPDSRISLTESARKITVPKVIEHGSSDKTKDPAGKPSETKPSEPLGGQPDAAPGYPIINATLWLILIGFNIYYIYDWAFVRGFGIGSLILGLIFLNLIVLIVLGGIFEFIKWLLKPADTAK